MGIPKNWRGKWTICLLVFWRSSVFLCCRVSQHPGCYQSAGCRNIPENVSLLSPSVSRQTREQQIAGIRPRFLPTLKTNGRGPWTWNIAFKNISESEFYDWLTKGTFRHLPKCILSNKLPFSALKCHCNGSDWPMSLGWVGGVLELFCTAVMMW